MKDDFTDDLSIDLTPLIDVIFMLLIFFIMTTTFSKPVIDVILPSSKTAENEKQAEEIVITVSDKGSIYYKDKMITETELVGIIEENNGSLLNLFIDKNAPFEVFVHLTDIAREKNNGRFVISTDVKDKDIK